MVTRIDLAVASPADFAELRRRFLCLPASPKLMAGREMGTDISSPGRQSLSLLIGEETSGALYATDVYLSPGFGAPPHHQPTEEELWYLLEGQLDVRVGLRTARLERGSFAFVPRDTTHTFKNNGGSPARLLAWNAPGGHERAFEAMGAKAKQGITAFPELRDMFRLHGVEMHADPAELAPNDAPGGKLAAKLVMNRAEVRDASQPGADVRVLLDARESGGEFEVSDVIVTGAGMLGLGHERAAACLYVLDGDADIEIVGQRQRVRAGAFAFIPKGYASSISRATEAPLHFVHWTTPAAAFGLGAS